jgi:drug/metabolite transporter (DMT)-like permease
MVGGKEPCEAAPPSPAFGKRLSSAALLLMSIPFGELAAFGTALCWTSSALAFSAAARRIGSLSLNLVRLVLAFAYLTVYCGLVRGMALPLDATREAWGWLFASGLVGFVFGDLCLFRAFVLIGPRLSMLVSALAPPITALFGWIALGERMSPMGLAGMAVTLAGVSWVVLERGAPGEPSSASRDRGEFIKGVILAFGGALGQAVGLVLSKVGMKSYHPFAATQIRILAGILGFSVIFTAVGWWKKTAAGLSDRRALLLVAVGAAAGPFLGVSLSLVSIQHTETGVAATIMSTVPVLIIPAVIVLRLERPSARSALGAAVAVCGVALLVLR